MSEAYVTLATNDGYAIGALVLGHSLRSVETSKKLVILISPSVTEELRAQLSRIFDLLEVVNVLDSQDSAHLALMKRPELGVTFTKLHCWRLTQFTKCVFLDADMLAVQNPDDLFSYPELSAACDVGWPDCFNSGMFVFTPSLETYGRLINFSILTGSFDGGDQGLLNQFFSNWQRVSFVYNMVASASYTYLPAYKRYGASTKIIHFLGALKPWHHKYDATSGTVHTKPGHENLTPYLNSWWAIYTRLVQPSIPPMDVKSAVEFKSPVEEIQVQVAQMSGLSISGEESLRDSQARWERGEPDYLGRDSFSNIQAYIDSKINENKKQ